MIEQARAILQQNFGYQDFRNGQVDVISKLCAGEDTLASCRLVAGSRFVTRFQHFFLTV